MRQINYLDLEQRIGLKLMMIEMVHMTKNILCLKLQC